MAQSDSAATLVPLAELALGEEESNRVAGIDFAVNREDAEVPVGTQLDWRLRGMLAAGSLRPGDRLPSVRELAEFAGVNVNTARAVYRRLEEQALIESHQGRGTFVAERAEELAAAGEIVERALDAAREAGVDPKLVAAALHSAAGAPGTAPAPEELTPFPEPDPSQSTAALKRELRDQIGRLEREIAAYAWHDPRQPAPKRPATAVPVGRVIGVEELERTRAELIDRLRRLRGEAAQRAQDQEEAREHIESMTADPAAHRWEIITSEQTGDPGCKNWRVVPAFGPVGAIMGWWRLKVSSGCPLAAPLAAATQSRG